jgi:hypothetical protein
MEIDLALLIYVHVQKFQGCHKVNKAPSVFFVALCHSGEKVAEGLI